MIGITISPLKKNGETAIKRTEIEVAILEKKNLKD